MTFYLVSISLSQAHTPRSSIKKVFLKILQKSQENILAGVSFFRKLQDENPVQILSYEFG